MSQQLIPGYLQNRYHDLQQIREASEKNDCPTIQVIAHTMKGNGRGYGFDEISKISKIGKQLK